MILVALALAAAPAHADKTVRLDPDVRPTRVELRLDVDPDRDFLLGAADIDVKLPRPQRVITLHGRNLEVSAVTVGGAHATYAQIDDEGTATVTADKDVGPGVVRVHLEWKAKLGQALEGVYATAFEGRRYIFTQMEAISARDSIPCFDEPGFKAPIALTLFVDDADTAVANAPEAATAQMPDGRRRVTFATTPPLPVYLLAFAVGPLDIVEGETLPPAATRKSPLPVRAVVPRGQGAKVKAALGMTADTVRVMEKYTGQGYAFGKLDFVAVPDFAWGGMENAGLIVYKDSRIYMDANPSIDREKGTLGLVAHETAHQWFGDLVTMQWWDDTWLNEAFATWMAFKVVEELKPEFLPRANMRSYTENVLGEDSMMTARQIRQRIESKADILDAFDGISYGKGASVIRMFEGYVGKKQWRAGIRSYMAERRYGNATARDLVDAVSRNSRKDITSAFFTFLEQPGAPFLDTQVKCDGAPRLEVTQSRYLPVGSSGSAAQTWALPVCALVDGKEMCAMLSQPTGAIDLGPGCPKNVLVDAGARGYFRWSLPAERLKPLVDGSVKLSPEEMIDVGGAIRAGFGNARLSYQDALALALPLAANDNPQVARTPMDMLWFARDDLVEEKLRPRVMKKIADTYAPVVKRLGTLPKDGDSAEVRELRVTALRALVYGAEDAATIQSLAPISRMRFGADDGVMQRDKAPGDLTDVLGAALVMSDPAVMDKLVARLDTLEDTQDRRDVLAAIGATTDPKQAAKLVELTLGKALKTSERLSLVFALGDNPRTRPIVEKYTVDHVDELLPLLPEARVGDLPFVFENGCSEDEARALEALFAQGGRAAKFSIARPVAQAAEGIRLCAAKKAAHQASARKAF